MQNWQIQEGWSAKAEATLAQLFHMRKAECEHKPKPSKKGNKKRLLRMQPE